MTGTDAGPRPSTRAVPAAVAAWLPGGSGDPSHPRAERWIAVLGVVVVVLTIVVGITIAQTHTRTGLLGTPLPPFLMSWAPDVRWPALVAVAVAGLLLAGAPALVERVRAPWLFLLLTWAASAALGLAVNASRRGPSGWSHVFQLNGTGSFEASREYLPALVDLRQGVAHYVQDFPQLLRGLPTHTKGNPPGPLVAMHLLGITTPDRLAAACIVVGTLCAPLAYLLGRELGAAPGVSAERRGRVAALLTAFSPSAVLFGVTSVDYVFAALATLLAVLLIARSPRARAAGCVLAGIAAFFSWVLLAIPVWAVLCTALREPTRAGGLSAAVRLAVGALAGVLGVTLVLALVWGYDPVAILHVARGVYAKGAAAERPYAFWVVGSVAAFLAMLGAPIAWRGLRALARREPAALALAAIIAVSTLAGFTKAETERIWLPYLPIACAAAAALPVRRLRLVLGVLAAQAILVEILFGTTW